MSDLNFVNLLSHARSDSGGTSLITLYVSAGLNNTWLASEQLSSELGTATNIKSKCVRKSVINSLKSGIQKLKSFNSVERKMYTKTGFVMCIGDISRSIAKAKIEEEGKNGSAAGCSAPLAQRTKKEEKWRVWHHNNFDTAKFS